MFVVVGDRSLAVNKSWKTSFLFLVLLMIFNFYEKKMSLYNSLFRLNKVCCL